MIGVSHKPITDIDVLHPESLAAREAELDARLLASPVTISQQVEVELIKRLQVTAPWLVPMTIRF